VLPVTSLSFLAIAVAPLLLLLLLLHPCLLPRLLGFTLGPGTVTQRDRRASWCGLWHFSRLCRCHCQGVRALPVPQLHRLRQLRDDRGTGGQQQSGSYHATVGGCRMVRCRAGHRGEHYRPRRRRGRSRGRGHRTAVRRTCQAIEGCHQNRATCVPPNCSVHLAPGCRTCLSCAATALLARARGAVKFLVLGVAVAHHGSDVVARGLPKRRVLEELPSDVSVRLHRALSVANLTSSPHCSRCKKDGSLTRNCE
jgi:hypothetical protein